MHRTRLGDRVVVSRHEGVITSEFHLNYAYELDVLVIRTTDYSCLRKIMQWAYWHARNYHVRRDYRSLIDHTIERQERVTLNASWSFFEHPDVPESVSQLRDDEILNGLLPLVKIIHANTDSYESGLNRIRTIMRETHDVDITWDAKEWSHMTSRMNVMFAVKDRKFCFWKGLLGAENMLERKHDAFNLVPPYHPARLGHKVAFMVNGATDAVLNGNRGAPLAQRAFISVHSPPESRVKHDEKVYGRSWNYMKHPFKAEGSSFVLTLDKIDLLGVSLQEDIIKILTSLLGLDETFMEIGQAFNSPYPHYENVLSRKKLQTPYPHPTRDHRGRGCESRCVWQYHFLKEEGVLEESLIPPWFLTEEWLSIFEGEQAHEGPRPIR